MKLLLILTVWSALWATISNPIVWVPIVLLIIAAIIKAVPTDSPASKWVTLIGNVLTLFLTELLKDKSKETDEAGVKLTHDEVRLLRRAKRDKKLRNLFEKGED